MKILCFIDNLGAGGAQRQLVGLTKMLREKGYDVCVVYYQPDKFFENELEVHNVKSYQLSTSTGKISLFMRIYKFFKESYPDVVISYLESPSMIACILRLLGLRFKIIVSERNTNVRYTFRDRVRFQLFRKSDYVVPNSYSQEQFLKKHCSYLSGKTKTITNFCSFLKFEVNNKQKHETPEISVVASIWPPKNTIRFIKALKILKDKGHKLHVSWYGKIGVTPYLKECEQLICENDLKGYICLLEKTPNIAEVYRQSDYLCLPSLYEGTPNVICEAICMSLPIICSDVCDNSIYVHQGENGFLFNPNDESDIAYTIERALMLNQEEYSKYSVASRKIAEQYLSETLFIDKYIRLIENE